MKFIDFGFGDKPDKAFVVVKSDEQDGIGIVFHDLMGDYELGERVDAKDIGDVLGIGLWFANAKAMDNFICLMRRAKNNKWGDE